MWFYEVPAGNGKSRKFKMPIENKSVSSLLKLKNTPAMGKPTYRLLSNVNLLLFKTEPSITALPAERMERFSLGCPSAFRSISACIRILITHRVFRKPLENKVLLLSYSSTVMFLHWLLLMCFGIYWEKQTKELLSSGVKLKAPSLCLCGMSYVWNPTGTHPITIRFPVLLKKVWTEN